MKKLVAAAWVSAGLVALALPATAGAYGNALVSEETQAQAAFPSAANQLDDMAGSYLHGISIDGTEVSASSLSFEELAKASDGLEAAPAVPDHLEPAGLLPSIATMPAKWASLLMGFVAIGGYASSRRKTV